MIEQADTQIKRWIQEALRELREPPREVEVSLGPPGQNRIGPGVSCYLLAVTESAPVRLPPSTTLHFELHYLITTFADTPEEAHLLLGHLAVAPFEHPDWVRDFQRIPAEVWAAFGVAPQPAFVLCVPKPWKVEQEVKRVLEPLKVLVDAEMGSFRGVLLGPGDQPIVQATLELTDLQLTTQTDTEGRFRFPAVPSQPRIRHLRIRAKGLVEDQVVEQLPDGQESKIYMKSLEGKE